MNISQPLQLSYYFFRYVPQETTILGDEGKKIFKCDQLKYHPNQLSFFESK